MISLFKKKENTSFENNFIKVDIHSHLLPGIDDGCKNIEESITCIRNLKEKGYQKLIVTPHVISGFYENTPQIITDKLQEVRNAVAHHGIDIQIEAAAEYYLDEYFISLIDSEERLLTFGKNYVLIELGFYNEPVQLASTVFALLSNGYKPVLAHPERYLYIYNQFDKVKEWIEKGLLMQINLLSLLGYYSPAAQQFSERLIEEELVSFVGTDAHNPKHLEALSQIYNNKYFLKLAESKLLNNTLI